MSRRPTQIPRWAWGGSAVLVQPAAGDAEVGFATATRPPAQWLNWMMNATGAWIDCLRGPNVETWTTSTWATSPSTYDSASPVLLAIDATTVDDTGAAYRYVIAGSETSGPTTTLRVSQRGTAWTRRTNISGSPVGTPTALAYFAAATRWLLSDGDNLFYATRDAGGATGPVGSGSGNWSTAMSGLASACVAIATNDSEAFALTVNGGWYSADGATWSSTSEGTARSGNGRDVVWTGSAWVYVTADGEVYSTPNGSTSASYKTTLAPGAAAWRLCAGENHEVIAYRVGSSSTLAIYRSTDDGATWAAVTVTMGFKRVQRIRYHEGTWLAVSTVAPFAWASWNLSDWTRLTAGTDALYDAAWDGGAWCLAGNGFVLQCPRGIAPSAGAYVSDDSPATLADAGSIQGRRVSSTAPTDGDVLTWDAGVSRWVPAAATGGALPITTQGDLVIGDAMGAAARLAKGADGMVLRAGATTVAWDWPLPEATAESQLLASTGAGRAYAAITSSALRALVSAAFRKVLELKSSQGWTLTQPSAGSTSYGTSPDAISVAIPSGTVNAGGSAELTSAIPDADAFLTFAVRISATTHNSSSGEIYVVQLGSSSSSILIGFVRGDRTATLAYYSGGSFVTLGTGTAPASWVSALSTGQAVLALVRTPVSVALAVGVGTTVSVASLATLVVSNNVIGIQAAWGDYVRLGLDVDTGSRASGTNVSFVQARTAAQGGGAL